VLDREDLGPNRHLHAEFLAEFADERGLERLAWLHLPARELPHPFEVLAGGSPCQQKRPVALDHGGGHDNGVHARDTFLVAVGPATVFA
jgi:hypothetical protein